MRYSLTKLSMHASLALIMAREAVAADDHGHAIEQTAHEAGAQAEHAATVGLPQLDPTWYASQLFWLLITFTVLYLVFAKKVLPALSSTIENRNERIQGGLEEAENLKGEAEKIHDAYEEILGKARIKSSDLFTKTEEAIKEQSARSMDKFRERSLSQTQKAEKRIQGAKKEAMKEMDVIAAEIASKAAEKIVGIPTDIDQAKSVIKNLNKKAA